MKKIFGSFLACCTFALLGACGQGVALPGAEIISPAESVLTVDSSQGSLMRSAAPLEFRVVGADGTTPVEDVEIQFFGGLVTQALVQRDGTALNQADSLYFRTTTDARGVPRAQVFVVFNVPPCKSNPTDPTLAGPDLTVTGTVTASIGVDTKTWRQNIVVKGCDPSP